MTPYSCMSTSDLAREYATVLDDYDQLKAQGLQEVIDQGAAAYEAMNK